MSWWCVGLQGLAAKAGTAVPLSSSGKQLSTRISCRVVVGLDKSDKKRREHSS